MLDVCRGDSFKFIKFRLRHQCRDHAYRLAVREKKVIRDTADKRHLTYSGPATSTQIKFFAILHSPPAMRSEGIDSQACKGFTQHGEFLNLFYRSRVGKASYSNLPLCLGAQEIFSPGAGGW